MGRISSVVFHLSCMEYSFALPGIYLLDSVYFLYVHCLIDLLAEGFFQLNLLIPDNHEHF